jgi:hypothetical protein
MKKKNWQIVFGLILLLLSAFFYILHYILFRDSHHIFIYMVGDIAFVFVEVLMVTLIIHRVLDTREKKLTLDKMNMVIGAFFSQIGTDLLSICSKYQVNLQDMNKDLLVKVNWHEERFQELIRKLEKFKLEMDSNLNDLSEIKNYLEKKTDFLLGMLENPILLEKDTFTDMLWAVFHIADELSSRKDLKDLPIQDMDHLSGDIKRAYKLLIIEWIHYLEHLKAKYPYLFSLAVRKNPFDSNSDVVIRN